MQTKNDTYWLGDGFSAMTFWLFNGSMIIAWMALRILQIFAVLGVGAILNTATEEVSKAPLGQLGGAFVNLMYGLSVIALSMLLMGAWLFGNLYILRKEIYEIFKRHSRWDEL